MRIAYVANIRLPTEKAHGLQIMSMCHALAQEGHEVRLIVPRRRNFIRESPWAFYGIPESFSIVEAPLLFDFIWHPRIDRLFGRLGLLLNSLQFLFGARREVRAFAPDAVYARDPWFADLDPSARYVYEAHEFPSRVTPLHRRAWARAARIVTVTEGLKRAFQDQGVPEAKLVVAHDGVDASKFDVKETRAEARAALGLPTEAFIAVYTGHLYPYKGADDLLEAAPHLRPASRVVFVGGRPDDLARLKARAAELDAANVSFVGQVPHAHVPAYLRAADAAVLPTRASGRHAAEFLSPLKLFEYLAAGKAIVATATPSAREVLSERAAMLVPPSDPAALAAALNDLVDVPAKREALEREALALSEKHSWRRRAARVLEGLNEPRPFQAWHRRYRAEISIAFLAFLLRASFVLFFPQTPIGGGDAPLYLKAADAIRGIIPAEDAPKYVQPLYPILLAAVRSVFGTDLAWIRLVQATLSAATVLLVAVTARRLVSPCAGVAAGLIAALWFPSVLETGMLYTETLYAFLLTLGVALTARCLERPAAAKALAAGAALALAGLTREIAMYLTAVLSALVAASRRPRLLAALIIAPTVLAAGLVMARNASLPSADGPAPVLSKGYEATLQDPNSRRFLLRWEMYPEGVWRFFRYPHRLAEISDETSTKAVLLSGDPARILPQAPRIAAKGFLTLVHWAVLLLAAYGLWRGAMDIRAKALLGVTVAFAAGTIILASVARLQGFEAFEPLARYRFPTEPLIIILAAAGLDRLRRRP